MHSGWASAGVLVAAIAAPSRANAAPSDEPVRLSFVRGENAGACFSESDLAARVTSRLGRDPFSPKAKRSIEAVVRRDQDEFFARIFVRNEQQDGGESRDLESRAPYCKLIEDAITLAISLAIDPEAALRQPASAPPAALPAPPITPPPVVQSAPPPLPPPRALAPAVPLESPFVTTIATRAVGVTGVLRCSRPASRSRRVSASPV